MNMNPTILSYKDLLVWKKAVDLATSIYELTKVFPSDERFGLTSQMRRAAVSIPSNIAEGRHRGTRKEFAHFLRISFGSGTELETQILIAKNLKYITHEASKNADLLLLETLKMINAMLKKLDTNS